MCWKSLETGPRGMRTFSWTDNKVLAQELHDKLKAEGLADKAKGKGESAIGGAKDAVRDAANKL